MADSHVAVTEGSGKNVDTRTNASGDHRQVIVIGDPSVTDNVAAVISQDVGGSDQTTPAAAVRLAGSAAVQIVGSSGTVGTHIQSTAGTINISFSNEPTVVSAGKQGTTTRHFLMNTDGAIKVYDIATGTIATVSTVAALTSITNSVAVHLLSTGGTLMVSDKSEPTVIASGKQGTTTRSFLMNTDGAIKVYDITTGTIATVSTVAALTSITNSVAVHLLTTGGTLQVKLDPSSAGIGRDDVAFTAGTGMGTPIMGFYDDTATDSVDEGDIGVVRMTVNRNLMVHTDSTASLFVASGSASGVSTSGNTIISPSSAYSFKIYAFSIQTTGQVSLTTKFTNGSGASPTEYWRPLITASGVTGAQGANLASIPSAPLFVTATNTTLSLVLDSATLVHYSVAYTKESTA